MNEDLQFSMEDWARYLSGPEEIVRSNQRQQGEDETVANITIPTNESMEDRTDESMSTTTNSGNNDADDESSSWMQRIDVSNFQRLATSDELKPENVILRDPEILRNRAAAVVLPAISTTTITMPKLTSTATATTMTNSMSSIFKMAAMKRPYNKRSLSPPKKIVRRPGPGRPPKIWKDHMMVAPSSIEISKKVSPPKKKKELPASTSPTNQQQQESVEVVVEEEPIEEDGSDGKYPKPVYSYSSLIALALKNSTTGRMHVAEIYSFICSTWPFFRTAASGWKNSVRHNLSLNKMFEKIVVDETTDGGHGKKYCLWALSKDKLGKTNTEIQKSRAKQPLKAKLAYANPEEIDAIENGVKGGAHGGGMINRFFSDFKSVGLKVKRPRISGQAAARALLLKATNEWQARKAAQSGRKPPVESKTKVQETISRWTSSIANANQQPAIVPYFTTTTRPLLPVVARCKMGESESQTDTASEGEAWIKADEDAFNNSDNDGDQSDDDEEERPIDFTMRTAEMTPPRSIIHNSSFIIGDRVPSTPPPLSFSTPVRGSPCSSSVSDSCWNSPVRNTNNDDRRQLWQLQQNTPERPGSFGQLLNNVQLSAGSGYSTPTRNVPFQFGRSFEFAQAASSPLNNSLIKQAFAHDMERGGGATPPPHGTYQQRQQAKPFKLSFPSLV